MANKYNEHAQWIQDQNPGGMNAYTKMQNDRYAAALKGNDVDLLNKLNADAQRVGYSLTTPTPELKLPEYQAFDYKNFSYDPKNDTSYKQYADMFARQGQSAGEQSLASTAAATGGMPSSYAAAANAQAQQAYAKKTADIIPELEQNAYGRYSNDRNLAYGEHQNIYNSALTNAQLSNEDQWKNLDYTDSRNDLEYDRGKADEAFDYTKFINEQGRNDNLNQLGIDNTYRQSAFDYGVGQDSKNFNYRAGQDSIGNSLSQQKFDYGKTQDELDRQDKTKIMNEERYRANLEANYPNTVMGQLESRDKEQKQAEADSNLKMLMIDAMQAKNPDKWLSEKGPYLTAEEYKIIQGMLKDRKGLQ